MHRNCKPRNYDYQAVRTIKSSAVNVLLRTGRRVGRKFEADEIDRRAVHRHAVLWNPPNDVMAQTTAFRGRRESQTDSQINAADGIGSPVPQTRIVKTLSDEQDIPVSLERTQHHETKSGLGNGHYLYSPAPRLCLFSGDFGLVQPVCRVMGNLHNTDLGVLHSGVGPGAHDRSARNLQLGSGRAIYKFGFYRSASAKRNTDQHGRPRSCIRQHIRGAVVEEREARGHLLERLRNGSRAYRRPQKIFSVLQQRSTSSGARKSVACGSVLELKIKVDFFGEAEKINLPKKGTGDRHANPVCGHSVSDGKNGTKIDKSQRRDYTLTQPVFCPINGVHLIVRIIDSAFRLCSIRIRESLFQIFSH